MPAAANCRTILEPTLPTVRPPHMRRPWPAISRRSQRASTSRPTRRPKCLAAPRGPMPTGSNRIHRCTLDAVKISMSALYVWEITNEEWFDYSESAHKHSVVIRKHVNYTDLAEGAF
jgi:hypothetical protein